MNSLKNIIIITPNKKLKSGIVDYSKLIFTIFNNYSKNNSYYFIDPSEIDDVKELLNNCNTLVLAQIGTQDGEVFRLMTYFKKNYPNLKRIIEIHDPSTIVLSPYNILINRNNIVSRVIRRFIHFFSINNAIYKTLCVNDIIVCKSEYAKGILLNKYNLKNRIHVVPLPNYIDPPLPYCQKKNNEINLGFFGFIDKSKGIHIIIEALNIIKIKNSGLKVNLLIAGGSLNKISSDYKDYLLNIIKNYKLESNIKFYDYLMDESQIIEFIKGVNYIVLPYLKKNSGSSSGPSRWALSCGTPVIASDSKIFKEFIPHDFLVSGNIVNNWVILLNRISTNRFITEDEIDQFICLDQFKYTWNKTYLKYEDIFKELYYVK
jgi:glycosyltransferase involved in cell wall biosynthesis